VDSSDISFDLELAATLIQPDPQLALKVSAGRSELRWPAPAGGFRLEQSTNLAPPVVWMPVTNSLGNDGYWNTIVLSNTAGTSQRFFRLNAF
jgi:hypothetical protein